MLPIKLLVVCSWSAWSLTHKENLQLFRGKTSQADARLECLTKGGYPVSIYSAEENALLLEFLQLEIRDSEDIPSIWTSGKRRSELPTEFDWADDRDEFSYTNWRDSDGGPSNNIDAECIAFNTTSGLWEDVLCGDPTRAFVCELPNLEFFREPQNWETASATCAEVENGTLVSVQSEVESLALEYYVRSNGVNIVWIGGSLNEEGLGSWTWSDNSGIFYPDDSRTATYYGSDTVPWIDGQPGSGDCLAIENNPNGWIARDCGDSMSFMCEYPPGYVNPDPIPNPDGTLIYFQLPSTFWEAETSCTAVGGHLASVLSAFENDFINEFAMNNTGTSLGTQVWIGGRNHLQNGTLFEKYTWTDNSGQGPDGAFLYENFDGDTSTDEPRCVEMGVDDGTWTSSNCDISNPFICRIPQWEYFPTPTTWYRANELCMNQSGSLVSILTVDQNNALRQFIEQESGDPEIHAWTGGNDLAEEGVFVWSDGSGAFIPRNGAYENFNHGEPNNGGLFDDIEEDCVEIDLSLGGVWHDNECTTEFPYVCEYSYNGDAPAPAPVDRDIEPYDPPQSGQWKNFVTPQTFLDATHVCQTEGGNLVSISSQLDQNALMELAAFFFADPFHLGLEATDGENFTWIDDTPLTFTNWAENEPVVDGLARCVLMDEVTGEWTTYSCQDSVTARYVCDVALRYDSQHSQWTYFSDAVSWPEAAQVCAEGAGHLVSVKTEAQNNDLFNFVQAQSGVETHVWLGGTTNNQGVFEWQDDSGEFWSLRDGSVGRYVNWREDEPNDFDVDQCVVLSLNDRLWEDRACHLEEASEGKYEPFDFVCEYPTPLTWHYAEGPFTFATAEMACRLVGGHLVGIHSKEDEDTLRDLLRSHGVNASAWIGGHAINTEGIYEWADGSGEFWRADLDGVASQYTNWDSDEPTNVGVEKCVSVDLETGLWRDEDCDMPQHAVCQYRSSPRRRHICEGFTDDIICPAGHHLNIISANYGRTQPGVCNTVPEDEVCVSETSFRRVSELCNGQQTCTLEASNDRFGNTCAGVTKYLDVVYECEPQRVDVCAGEMRVLACPLGKQILITENVDYGIAAFPSRCGNGTSPVCSSKDETFVKLSEKCNGHRVCFVEAIDEEFTPCENEEEEFLRAEYECIPPPTPMPTAMPTPMPTGNPSPMPSLVPTIVDQQIIGDPAESGHDNTIAIAASVAVVGLCCIAGGILVFCAIRRRKEKENELRGDEKDIEVSRLENGYGFKPVGYDTSSPARNSSPVPPGGMNEPGTGFTPASTMTRPSVSLPPGVGSNGLPQPSNGDINRIDRSHTTITPLGHPDEHKHDDDPYAGPPSLAHRTSSPAAADDSGTDSDDDSEYDDDDDEVSDTDDEDGEEETSSGSEEDDETSGFSSSSEYDEDSEYEDDDDP